MHAPGADASYPARTFSRSRSVSCLASSQISGRQYLPRSPWGCPVALMCVCMILFTGQDPDPFWAEAMVSVGDPGDGAVWRASSSLALQRKSDGRSTGSEGCLLLYSVVGNSLIFPIPLRYLPNLKPGAGRRVRQCTATQQDAGGVFRAIRAASLEVHRCVETRFQCFLGKQPAPTPGLSEAILRHARIKWSNSAPTSGLTAV